MKCTEAELCAPHYDIRSHSYYTHNGVLCPLTDYQCMCVCESVCWMVMGWGRPAPAQNANVTLVDSGDKPCDPFAKAQCCCFLCFFFLPHYAKSVSPLFCDNKSVSPVNELSTLTVVFSKAVASLQLSTSFWGVL